MPRIYQEQRVLVVFHSSLEARQSNQSDLSIRERQFIFAARSRMLDVRSNFKVGLKSTQCRRCEDAEETQEHLLYCPTLRDGGVVTDVPQYDNLLGEETQKIIIISRILSTKFNKLVKTPCAPSTCAATLRRIGNK